MVFTQDKFYAVPGENAWKLSRQASNVYDKKRWKEEEEEYIITQWGGPIVELRPQLHNWV